MVPAKSWHSQMFHPISKSRQPLRRVLKYRLYSIYFGVISLASFGLSLRFANKGLGVSVSLGFYHLSPLEWV